jgi:apolipoprotein N-acyltransferase
VYAGTFVPTMIPWTVAGGVSPWPAMVQAADVVGERGVAFLMALVAGLAASAARLARGSSGGPARRRAAAAMTAAAGIVGAQAIYGAARMRAIDAVRAAAPTARVALVQPGTGASIRWEEARAPEIVRRLEALTAGAEARGADLVVWPEAAYPYRLAHGARGEPAGVPAIVGPGLHGPVLTGLLTAAADGASYNSAILATRGGLTRSYDKRRLMWFGETVPLADRLPWVRHVFARGLGLSPGDGAFGLLEAGAVRAAPLICYEDTLPEAGRDAAAWDPNLLVNLTNDAWFGGEESELHMRIAALRAVELRRDLVRAVNVGVPSWFDAAGRLRARGSPDFVGVLETRPALVAAPPTVFARFGDAPWALVALVAANVAVWAEARRGRRG